MNKNGKLNRNKSFLCMLSNFSRPYLSSVDFFKLTFSKHLTGPLYRYSVGPDLGPNCLYRSAADD